jgi:superfamily II DNA or RNA helicase
MDYTINLYEYYKEQFKIFNKKFNEHKIDLSKIIPDENTVKQILATRKDYCQLSPEINELLIKYGDTSIIQYLDYIKNFIKKKFMDNETNDYIKEKLLNNTIPLGFNNIYKVLLNDLISKNFINNIIEDSDNQSVVINTDDYTKIKYYEPRCNQQEAFDRLENNGLETGIHCQATGCGKSYIILYYIDYCIRKFKNNCKIILFTERINILVDLFGLSKNNKYGNPDKIEFWKNNNIANLKNLEILNIVNRKDRSWANCLNSTEKPTLVLINRAYLTSSDYEVINNLSIILHDECHNTTSNNCNNFLTFFKNKTKIVGFSATPLRTGKNELEELSKIYGDKNNKLKLLTNYNLLFSMDKDLILYPEFYWYELKDNINMVEEFQIIFKLLKNLITNLPNKKIVAWCGTINRTKKWKKIFEDNSVLLPGFKYFIDTSQNTNDDYEKYYKSKGNSILFCASKHREGSDIPNLDACMFLDKVKNRGSIPFIQSIGRVLRKENNLNSKKQKGVIIEGLHYKKQYEEEVLEKIIKYYFILNNVCDDDDTKKNKFEELSKRINIDNDNKQILLNLNNNNTLKIKVYSSKWNTLINKLIPLLNNKIKIVTNNILHKKLKTPYENIDFKFSKIKNCNINNIDFKSTSYKSVINYIYNLLNNLSNIKKNTIMNIKQGFFEQKGFKYNKKLDISIQGVDANTALKEIYNQCKCNNLRLVLHIELENGTSEIIMYKHTHIINKSKVINNMI